MEQKTIIIETTQTDGVNLWGVSLGTGYPWFVELPIILVVMGFVYGMKKGIDHFENEKQRLNKKYSNIIKKQELERKKKELEKDIWKNVK